MYGLGPMAYVRIAAELQATRMGSNSTTVFRYTMAVVIPRLTVRFCVSDLMDATRGRRRQTPVAYLVDDIGGGRKSLSIDPRKPTVPARTYYFHYSIGFQQMAGVKGKSGGPRKNAGGARPGAGRPRKMKNDQKPQLIDDCDMLQMLQDVALGKVEATALQVRAAIAAVQYTHAKMGEGGKKEKRQAEAEKVAGRFTSAAPPRLVAQNGKKV